MVRRSALVRSNVHRCASTVLLSSATGMTPSAVAWTFYCTHGFVCAVEDDCRRRLRALIYAVDRLAYDAGLRGSMLTSPGICCDDAWGGEIVMMRCKSIVHDRNLRNT